MSLLQIKYNKLVQNLFFFILIFSFLLPIIIFGKYDLEEYQQGYFSNKILFNNPLLYFNTYLDFLGPGVDFPIGFFLYHPSILLIKYDFYFFISFCIINIYLQLYFVDKILNLLNVKKNILLVYYLIVFSISNFQYFYADDWPIVSFTYSLIYPCIYYLVKFQKKFTDIIFYKLVFWLSYQFFSGHYGHFSIYCFGYFLIFLNYYNKEIFQYKKLKYGIFIFLLISSENIFWFTRSFFINSDTVYVLIFFLILIFILFFIVTKLFYIKEKVYELVSKYKYIFYLLLIFLFFLSLIYHIFWHNWFKGYYLDLNFIFFNFISNFDIFTPNYKYGFNRYYSSGVEILLFLIILYFKYYNSSDFKVFLSLSRKETILLTILIILIIPREILNKIPPSGYYQIRDFIIILSSIIIATNLSIFKKNLNYLKVIIIIFPLLLYAKNIVTLSNLTDSNFIRPIQIKETNLINQLKSFKTNHLKENDLNRVLLSPGIQRIIRNNLRLENFFAITDFIKLDIHPVNVWCKKCSMQKLFITGKHSFALTSNFYGQLDFNYELINNKKTYYFLKSKYLFLLESELEQINLKNFNIIKKIDTKISKWPNQYKTIIYDKIIIAKIRNPDLSLIAKKIKDSCETIKCIIDQSVTSISNNILFESISLNKYKIKNNGDEDLNFIFPFNNKYQNWKSKNKNSLINLKNMTVINLRKDEENIIYYEDNYLLFFRILSLTVFMTFILVLIFYKKGKIS